MIMFNSKPWSKKFHFLYCTVNKNKIISNDRMFNSKPWSKKIFIFFCKQPKQ